MDTLFVVLESDGNGAFVILGPLAAVAFWGFIRRHYRNQDKRFKIEETSDTEAKLIRSEDNYMNTVKGSRQKYIKDRNDHEPTVRVWPRK